VTGHDLLNVRCRSLTTNAAANRHASHSWMPLWATRADRPGPTGTDSVLLPLTRLRGTNMSATCSVARRALVEALRQGDPS
jgi:hypothetical protein